VIVSIVGLDVVASQVAKACVKAPKLSYVPLKEQVGTVPWAKHPWEKDVADSEPKDVMYQKRPVKDNDSINRLVLPIVAASLGVYVITLFMFGMRRESSSVAINACSSPAV
jgi:hypothetical protein